MYYNKFILNKPVKYSYFIHEKPEIQGLITSAKKKTTGSKMESLMPGQSNSSFNLTQKCSLQSGTLWSAPMRLSVTWAFLHLPKEGDLTPNNPFFPIDFLVPPLGGGGRTNKKKQKKTFPFL